MEIPAALVQQIREGRTMLFLGAGATIGATSAEWGKPPTGAELAAAMAERFLGGEDADKPLSVVSELAVSEVDLTSVQNFIYQRFSDLEPAEFHRLIPTFRWAAIATTNYDLVVERAYHESKLPLQTLVPFYKSTDRVDAQLRSADSVPYVKLHGCISRREDLSVPLILTIDQYVTHRKNRKMLFERVKQYASEYSVVFIGHSLEDPDVRQVLLELAEEGIDRPRFYLVTPSVSERQARFWETKKITAIQGTMQEFLESLNDSLDSTLRSVETRTTSHPLESRISQADRGFSEETLTWLDNELVYVRADLPCDQVPAQEFYRGASYGWSPIQQDFDVARSLTDSILNDCVLVDEVDRTVACDFYLIKGHAGSGKTVVLKRLAWDATVAFSKICLYYADMARIPYDAITEIAEAVDERIFLFIERPAEHTADVAYLLRRARREGLQITVICAERGNEWNMECGILKPLVTEVYDLRYLSRREIVNLLSKLKQNNCLGLLGGLTEEERIAAFEKKAGRQLLVALHEATLGKPFEDIIHDEFQSIEPEGARQIYLTICTLNRLDVVVRAGVIKRVHGVSFDEFRQKFFMPLESIVQILSYTSIHDMAYQARHPWIAEVVFERALKSADERYDLYLQLLDALDIGYEADRRAFRRLIRARDLVALFPDPRLVRALYEKARETVGEDAYLYQQRAIFEMRRENPNLALAYEHLTNAARVAPHDKSIVHTLAELEIERSKRASSAIEQGRHLGAAQRLARSLTGSDTGSSYGFHTLCKIGLDELRIELSSDAPNDQSISACVKSLEKDLDGGLQRFPDDEYLLDAEARLAKLVQDDAKAVQSLERAFRSNPTSPFIAKGLARLYELGGQKHRSRETLEACLETRPGDKGLNAALAKLLTKHFPDEGKLAEYYWRRSFTEGDANYSNQFWYARQLYVNGKAEDASLAFRNLRGARVAPEVRNKMRGVLDAQDGSVLRLRGRVERLEATYALVSQLDNNMWAFLHRRRVSRSDWEQITLRTPLSFRMAFTYNGLAAFEVKFVT